MLAFMKRSSENALLSPRTACPTGRQPDSDAGREILQNVLDLLSFGVVLLKCDRSVHCANYVALQECRAGGALLLSSGRLNVRDEAGREPFDRAVQATQRGLRSMLTVNTLEGVRPLVVAPLPRPDHAQTSNDAQALIMLGRSRDGCRLIVEMFSKCYDLTLAETAVLRGLYEGQTPRALAQTLNVAVCTIRTHIGHVRRKTGDADIRNLLAAVQGLPPLAPARTIETVDVSLPACSAEVSSLPSIAAR